MNYDERLVIVYQLEKIIFSIVSFARVDSSLKITIEMHIPLDGDIVSASHYCLKMEDNFNLYYYINRRSNIREDVNIRKPAEDKDNIIVQYYNIHY